MKSLLIVRPTKVSAYAGAMYSERSLSDDPKEAWTTIATGNDVGYQGIDMDLGGMVELDSIYVGYHNAPAGVKFAFINKESLGGKWIGYLVSDASIRSPGYSYPYNLFRSFDKTAVRYVSFLLIIPPNTPPFKIGVLAFGESWQSSWGTEWGAGRTIEDTGTAERLFGGGFGIDEGVAAGGYQWTFGDLTTEEVRTLYQLVKERRTTRTVLVVEDPDQTDGLSERTHWGLFRKIDAYERLDPQNTKWSLQISDWA